MAQRKKEFTHRLFALLVVCLIAFGNSSELLSQSIDSLSGVIRNQESVPDGLEILKLDVDFEQPSRYQRQLNDQKLPEIVSPYHRELIAVTGSIILHYRWSSEAKKTEYFRSLKPTILQIEVHSWPLISVKEFAHQIRNEQTLASIEMDSDTGLEKIVWHLESKNHKSEARVELERRKDHAVRDNRVDKHTTYVVFSLKPNDEKFQSKATFQMYWNLDNRNNSYDQIWIVESTSLNRSVHHGKYGIFQTSSKPDTKFEEARQMRILTYKFLTTLGLPMDPFYWFDDRNWQKEN